MPRPKSTSIRLLEDARELLAALQEDLGGISQSDVVRLALRELAKARGLIESKPLKR